jgi:hypothetical protein
MNSPEVERGVRELDTDFPPTKKFRTKVDHTAFSLFLGVGVHQENPLPSLYFRVKSEQSAVSIYRKHRHFFAEWVFVLGQSRDSHGHREGHAPAPSAILPWISLRVRSTHICLDDNLVSLTGHRLLQRAYPALQRDELVEFQLQEGQTHP